MLKYFWLVLVLLGMVVVGLWWGIKNSQWPSILFTPSSVSPATVVPLPEEGKQPYALTLEKLQPIQVDSKSYRFAWVKIDDLQRLQLYPNFTNKKAAKNLMENNRCRFLVNGGFYDKDFHPLGWFYNEGQVLSLPQTNRLLNGFLSLNATQEVLITDLPPQGMVKWGLQSGPLLIMEGQKLTLKIRDDEYKRRMIGAINQNGELFFLSITDDTSLNSGPLLANLPGLVAAISHAIDEKFTSALNLDGGSASAFLTDKIQIEETSIIGSFFCEQ